MTRDDDDDDDDDDYDDDDDDDDDNNNNNNNPCHHLYAWYLQLYIPETNHVSRVYSVAAVLYLQFVLHSVLFYQLGMFCTFTSALPTVCVQCTIWMFLVVP